MEIPHPPIKKSYLSTNGIKHQIDYRNESKVVKERSYLTSHSIY